MVGCCQQNGVGCRGAGNVWGALRDQCGLLRMAVVRHYHPSKAGAHIKLAVGWVPLMSGEAVSAMPFRYTATANSGTGWRQSSFARRQDLGSGLHWVGVSTNTHPAHSEVRVGSRGEDATPSGWVVVRRSSCRTCLTSTYCFIARERFRGVCKWKSSLMMVQR